MPTFKAKNKGNQTVVKCKLDYSGAINGNEIPIVNSGCMPGLAAVMPAGGSKINYVVPATASLGDVLRNYGITVEQLSSIIKQVLYKVGQVRENGLSPDNLLLNLEHSYFDLYTGIVYLIYQPLFKQANVYTPAAFVSSVLQNARMIDDKGKDLASGLGRFMAENPDASATTIYNALERLERNGVRVVALQTEDTIAPQVTAEPKADEETYMPGYDESFESEETFILEEPADDDDMTMIIDEPVEEPEPEPVERALFVREEDGARFYMESDVVTLGRMGGGADCIVSEEKTVGRKHATFYSRDGRYFILDNESTNGTFVNDNRLSSGVATEITSGDKITLAKTVLQFLVEIQ
ncbi:MAG: FHA domain-containing protein [Bacillota bacterium]|nr:FHA domain-containing protein [Bacillota bacterium]